MGIYRYGYNGKEKDDDVNGTGVTYDYGFRIYYARIARFLSVDPLTQKYPWYTPYQFAGNTPIAAIDLDGAEPLIPKEQYYNNQVRLKNVPLEVSYSNGGKAILIHAPTVQSPHKAVNTWVAINNNSDGSGTSYHFYNGEHVPGTYDYGYWTGDWQEYYPVTQEGEDWRHAQNMGNFCDVFAKSFAGTMVVGAGFGTGVLKIGFEYAFLKGTVSAGIQATVKGKIDFADVLGDAVGNPVLSALVGSSFDYEFSIKDGKMLPKKLVLNGSKSLTDTQMEFINSTFWGIMGNSMGNSVGGALEDFTKNMSTKMNNFVKGLFEFTNSTITTTGEQGVEKIMEKNQ